MSNPLISVILPVHNAELYLEQAIKSVLMQTVSDFELLIYNDGSTDHSNTIIESFSDPRILYKKFEKNQGLIKILNLGFDEASGEYIARMDADDICYPDRFRLQLDFMQTHPDCGICGTQIRIIGNGKIIRKPCTDQELRWWVFKGTPFAHPTVMIRKSIIIQNTLKFNPDAIAAEDFDLWWRMAFYTSMANLDTVLLDYRVHSAQVSSNQSKVQFQSHRKSLNNFLNSIGLNPSQFSVDWIRDSISGEGPLTPLQLRKKIVFFDLLNASNSAVSFFGKEGIKHEQQRQLKYTLRNLSSYNPTLLLLLLRRDFTQILKQSGKSIFEFVFKSLVFWKTRTG